MKLGVLFDYRTHDASQIVYTTLEIKPTESMVSIIKRAAEDMIREKLDYHMMQDCSLKVEVRFYFPSDSKKVSGGSIPTAEVKQ